MAPAAVANGSRASSGAAAASSSLSGAVSAAEAAAAVADMLSAAGLPAGADTRELLTEALALRKERDALAADAAQLKQVDRSPPAWPFLCHFP